MTLLITFMICTLFVSLFVCRVKPILTPAAEYTVQGYMDMAARQVDFVLDAQPIPFAGINPSFIRDPHDRNKILMV